MNAETGPPPSFSFLGDLYLFVRPLGRGSEGSVGLYRSVQSSARELVLKVSCGNIEDRGKSMAFDKELI